MGNRLDFFIKLKMMNKAGTALPARNVRETLLAESLGPAMHAKLNQAHRARRKRGGS